MFPTVATPIFFRTDSSMLWRAGTRTVEGAQVPARFLGFTYYSTPPALCIYSNMRYVVHYTIRILLYSIIIYHDHPLPLAYFHDFLSIDRDNSRRAASRAPPLRFFSIVVAAWLIIAIGILHPKFKTSIRAGQQMANMSGLIYLPHEAGVL